MSEVKTNKITSLASNNDITLDPDGTGDTIIASGNLGIGTSSPNNLLTLQSSGSTKLNLRHTASGDDYGYIFRTTGATTNDLIVESEVNGTATERLRVDSSGFVGIGESAPKKMVHITKNDSDGLIILDADGATTDHQICFSKDYGSGGTTGGNYWGIGVDGSENKLVFAYDTNAQASLSADAKVVLDSSGEVIIGATTTGASSCLRLDGNGTVMLVRVQNASDGTLRNGILFRNASDSTVGVIQVNNSSTNYATSSDYRLKEAVVNMTGAIDRVKALAPKRFNFIVDPDRTVDGFLAHEAQAVVPEAITGTKDEVDDDGNAVMQGIDQSKLVPLLTGALQEAIAKIETLETKVAALEAGE